ncbi:MAG: PAS domain S-box protein, partial [Candidatus Binatia bacterium]|nr:PAS domain S-box protein [Candidatus Binatia bacterium]
MSKLSDAATNGSSTGSIGQSEREALEVGLSSPDASTEPLLCVVDAAGHIRQINSSWSRSLGRDDEALVGTRFLDLVHPDDRAPTAEFFAEIGSREKVADFRNRIVREPGKFSWIQWAATADPESKRIYLTAKDITELARARAEQERTADDLTRLIDTANAPIIGIDAEGRVNEWNQTAARITGFDKAEVLGRNLVNDFITDDYKAAVKEVLDKALRG